MAISRGNQLHQEFMHMTSGLLTFCVNTFLSLFSSPYLPSFSSQADYPAFPEVTPPYPPDLSAAHVLSLTFLLLISQELMAPFWKEDIAVSLCLSLYHAGLFDSSSHLVYICIFIADGVNLKYKNDLGLFIYLFIWERCGTAPAYWRQTMLYTERVYLSDNHSNSTRFGWKS